MPAAAAVVAAAFVSAGTAIAGAATAAGVAIGNAALALGLGDAVASSLAFGVADIGGAIGSGIIALGGGMGTGAAFSAWVTTIGLAGSIASMALFRPPASAAGVLSMKLDPQAGIPILYGRSATGGNVVFRETYGDNNRYAAMINVLSAGGPIKDIEAAYANNFLLEFGGGDPTNSTQKSTAISPNGGNTSMFVDRLRMSYRLGRTPETSFAAETSLGLPLPTSSSSLSGLASVCWVCDYNQAAFPGLAIPPMVWVASGVSCWDPRQDSSAGFGGSGSQRLAEEGTWEFSENPYICALNWILGHYENGVKVYGIGASLSQVDVSAFIVGANVADAHGWKVGGVVTTTDDKYTVLQSILQAGSGQPISRGAQLSCFVNQPVTSVYTLGTDDIVGQVQVQNSTSWRDRKNRIVAQYREETQFWQVIAGPLITGQSYLEEDGGVFRTQENVYSLVQNVTQAQQLATYDLANSREFLTFSVVCKPALLDVRTGDCITLNVPDVDANNQKCVVVGRSVDPASLNVTLTLRSETDAKHAYALGQTATAPPSPTLNVPLNPAPGPTAWAITSETYDGVDGSSIPALVVSGACDDPNAQSIIFEYQVYGSGVWQTFATSPVGTLQVACTSVSSGVQYEVAVSYQSVRGVVGDRLILGPVTAGDTIASSVAGQGYLATANNVDWTANTAAGGGVINIPPGLQTDPNGNLNANAIAIDGASLVDYLDDVQTAAASANANAAAVANTVSQFSDSISNTAQSVINYSLQNLNLQNQYNSLLYDSNGVALPVVVATETNNRIQGDQQLANTISLIGSQTTDGTAFNINLESVMTAPGVSFAQTLNNISATANAVAGGVSSNTITLIDNESNARAAGDQALSNTISTLNSTLTTANTTLTAAIQTVNQTLSNSIYSTANTVTALTSTVTNNNTTVTALINNTANTSASQYSALTNTLALMGVKNAGGTAFILNENTVQFGNTGTVATVLNGINSTTSGLSSQISSLSNTVTTNNTTQSNNLSSLSSTVTNNYNSLNSAITTESNTRASNASALAQSINSVSTTVSGHTASINTLQNSVNGLNAQYVLTVSGAAGITGFALASGTNGQAFNVYSSNFRIVDGSGNGNSPFAVSGGAVYMQNVIINGNLLINGTIQTPHLASGAASAIVVGTNSGGGTLPSSATGVIGITVNSSGGKHIIDFDLEVSAAGGANTGVLIQVYRDGNLIKSFGRYFQASFSSGQSGWCLDIPGAGSHSYSIYINETAGSNTGSQWTSASIMSTEFRQAG